jgi:hypothetical protein
MPDDKQTDRQDGSKPARPPLVDPTDIDIPPYFYGHELPLNKKIILLIAGLPPQKLIKRISASGGIEVVPADLITPAELASAESLGNVVQAAPPPAMAKAWTALTEKYSSTAFKNDDWALVRLWATSKVQPIAALKAIGKKNPLGLAVHYIGHGNDKEDDVKQHLDGLPWDVPLITVEPLIATQDEVKRPGGGKTMGWDLVPESGNGRSDQALPTLDLVHSMMIDVPTAQVRTLIVDGCEQALALTYATSVRVVVSEDFPRQESDLGAFSQYFSPHVTPLCLDQIQDKLEKAVEATREAMNAVPITSGFSDVTIGGEKIDGGLAYQNPSCGDVARHPRRYHP